MAPKYNTLDGWHRRSRIAKKKLKKKILLATLPEVKVEPVIEVEAFPKEEVKVEESVITETENQYDYSKKKKKKYWNQSTENEETKEEVEKY